MRGNASYAEPKRCRVESMMGAWRVWRDGNSSNLRKIPSVHKSIGPLSFDLSSLEMIRYWFDAFDNRSLGTSSEYTLAQVEWYVQCVLKYKLCIRKKLYFKQFHSSNSLDKCNVLYVEIKLRILQCVSNNSTQQYIRLSFWGLPLASFS